MINKLLRLSIFAWVAAVLTLSTGCSMLHGGKVVEKDADAGMSLTKPDPQDLTDQALTGQASAPAVQSAPSGQTVPDGANAPVPAAPPDQFTGTILPPASTDESVQVFSLDEPAPVIDAPAGQPVQSLSLDAPGAASSSPLSAKGVPYTRNSSVEVFPFDDQTDIGNLPATAGLIPPSGLGLSAPFSDKGWAADHADSTKLYFKNGSSILTQAGREAIAQIAANAAHDKLVSVEGHASKRAAVKDPAKKHIVNLKMSMQRAVKVSQALIKKGVPASHIKTTAWGDSQPPFLTDPGMDAEAASRRVEIFTQPAK